MGTEWKGYSYSPVLKRVMLVLAWFSFAGLMLSVAYLVMVPQTLAVFSSEWTNYSATQREWILTPDAQWALYGGITALVSLMGCITSLVITAGRRGPDEPVVLRPIDRLYTDVHTGLVMVAALAILLLMGQTGDPWNRSFRLLLFGLSFLSAMIGSSWILSLVRLGKVGRLFSHSLIHTSFSAISGLFRLLIQGEKAWLAMIGILGGYAAGNGALVLMLLAAARGMSRTGTIFLFFLLAGINLLVLLGVARWLVAFAEIRQRTLAMAAGDLHSAQPSRRAMPFLLREMAYGLDTIGEGHRRAVEEAVRGERMKTDLITNVSHDLKTPLTSIVNYVDLLGREALQNEKAAGYVKVLEEKAARMKQLVEDLVEASKASSGNLTVNTEILDFHQLVQQACGEFENRFWLANLDVRLRSETGVISILADGRHVWRVLENLLTNVCKYALSGTRVYVDLVRQDGQGMLLVKNVSATPLDMPVEQLTERFVRGDVSRSTEGSGLGLSIARSLTELMGGQLQLEIDGDLFKAAVKLPLAEAPAEQARSADGAAPMSGAGPEVGSVPVSDRMPEADDGLTAGGNKLLEARKDSARSNIRRIAERKRLQEPDTAAMEEQVAGQ